eukprot:Skav229323  [mRNA]  locus=scaffold2688:50926:56779:- [translate_table: standard]
MREHVGDPAPSPGGNTQAALKQTQDEQGRWNVFTSKGIESRKSFAGVMDWQGWAVTLGDKFSDGTGERGPGQYDDKFDAAPDIDHGNKKVQQSIAIWLRWLRLDVGFDAWRQNTINWINATDKETLAMPYVSGELRSAAFDFTTKGILQDSEAYGTRDWSAGEVSFAAGYQGQVSWLS